MTPTRVGPLEESKVWVDERSTVPGRRALPNAHGALCKIAELSSGLEKLHSPSTEEKENARDKIKRHLPTIVSCLTALNNARQVIEEARNNGKWPMTRELEELTKDAHAKALALFGNVLARKEKADKTRNEMSDLMRLNRLSKMYTEQ